MISGILLAGGRSRRMGKNKVFAEFGGKPLYAWPLDVLRETCDEIIISAPGGIFPDDFPFLLIPDVYPDSGPLGGIYSCMREMKHERAVVLSCDIPFITSSYVETLHSLMQDAPAIAGLNSEHRPEPLAAIYHVSLLNLAEELIRENKLKMDYFLSRAGAILVDVARLGYDTERLFHNVNTRHDLGEADRWLK